jgi:hypothetical protein
LIFVCVSVFSHGFSPNSTQAFRKFNDSNDVLSPEVDRKLYFVTVSICPLSRTEDVELENYLFVVNFEHTPRTFELRTRVVIS